MNPAPHPAASAQSRSRGMALVVVLGMLALVIVLMVAFLTSISTDLKSAKLYASGLDARSLADSTVNIVISQIQDATANPRLAWASQPGMVRTYDGNGQAVAAYKLYSSNQIRVNGAFDAPGELSAEVPADWNNNKELFTDLNRPFMAGGQAYYPILDPSAVAASVSGGTPLSGTDPAIEGCFLDTSYGATAVSAGQANAVPMPVRWMYVLQDGQIVEMNNAKTVAGAGTANPIVGRIAFWADDETCKVNLNTASEGTFWDRPWTNGSSISGSYPGKTSSSYEMQMAINMPAQNEFQRYPGHPAMTCLSPVFPRLNGETVAAYNSRLYGILPRINNKDANGNTTGSESNTRNVDHTTAPISPDTDRLFASVDEFFFGLSSGAVRQPANKAPGTPFTERDIERARFFLTANSRAPEVNLFNKPRVSLWPLQINPDPVTGQGTRTSKDKLIAFCSTIGSKPYYFQRYNTYSSANPNALISSQSPTMDWNLIARNQELYAYLQSLAASPIPGLGGSFQGKYPHSCNQILTEMFDYIRSNINTFSTGESPQYFYTPFNTTSLITGQSQIVPLALPNGTKGFGRFSTVTEAALIFYRKDKLNYSLADAAGNRIGPYVEAPDGTTTIAGRIKVYENEPPAPQEVGVVLLLEPFNPSPGPPIWSGHVRFVIKGLDSLALNGASATDPFPSSASNLVTGQDSTNNATALTGLEQYTQYRSTASGKFTNAKTLGHGNEESNYPFYATFVLPSTATAMNFSGGTITIEIYPGAATTLDNSTLIQTITMEFPPRSGLAIPSVSYSNSYSSSSGNSTLTTFTQYRDFDARTSRMRTSATNQRYGIAEDNQHNPLPFIIASGTTGDIVRSVEARYGGPARGDYRLFAGLKDVPASYFEGHGKKDTAQGTSKAYDDTTSAARLVHSLTIDGMAGSSDTSSQNGYYSGAGGNGDTRGKLVSSVAYPDPNRGNNARNRKVPIVPRGLPAALMSDGSTLGDWDTGIGAQPDGPYINPADQAAARFTQTSNGLYYTTGGYLTGSGVQESGASFSPNRQISSAASFGSLPTGANPADPDNSKPWQTLLFCKNPAGKSSHPGFGAPAGGPPYATPPDHAFLDFFTMPIVEPYAISEPFSTAGKVNMNYQIVPFTYLTRSTGVRAVLKSTQMMAIPTGDGLTYKLTNSNPACRYTLNPSEQNGTLAGFEQRFASGDIFRSASEICDLYLVPDKRVDGASPAGNPSYAAMDAWWNSYLLTGDNLREQPYGHLYPRLTTKSNTFTVHVMTQSLQKVPATAANTFVEGTDQVTGEFRGSFVIERYLDPNADSLVKADGKTPGSETDPDSMVGPYKFRILSSKRFTP